jgi:hypothetical protein
MLRNQGATLHHTTVAAINLLSQTDIMSPHLIFQIHTNNFSYENCNTTQVTQQLVTLHHSSENHESNKPNKATTGIQQGTTTAGKATAGTATPGKATRKVTATTTTTTSGTSAGTTT